MRTTEIRLSADFEQKVLAAGGASFAPRARNRCLCLQLKDLGPLTRRQVSIVRSAAEAIVASEFTRQSKSPTVAEVPPSTPTKSLPQVIKPDFGCIDMKCPFCTQMLFQIRQGIIDCPNCGRSFELVVRPPTPEENRKHALGEDLLAAMIDSSGDVKCPLCLGWNFRVQPGIWNCCRCGKNFMAKALLFGSW